jgi:hypothetical protein
MKTEGTTWFEGLKAYVAECRAERPIKDRNDLSLAEEIQCRIIGGSFISWLRKHGLRLIQERTVLAEREQWENDPFIVFTSEESGLVAAREILEDDIGKIVFLYPAEFEDWAKRHPDGDYRWHIHTWSYFAPLDPATKHKAAQYPLAAGETYWLHKEGTMCGRLFGRGGDHLWKWNGKAPMLLQERLNQWVS